MTKEYAKTNLNYYVKVKLTDVGISILEKQHNEINEKIKAVGGKGLGTFKLKLDDNGYYVTQIHSLMQKFKDNIGVGFNLPYETNILTQVDAKEVEDD